MAATNGKTGGESSKPKEPTLDNIPPPDFSKKFTNRENDDYGYYFYPGRHGKPEQSWLKSFIQGKDSTRKMKCEQYVEWCAKNNPMVKLLIGAMKSHGCDINLKRHVSCERCRSNVTGGYDPMTNQAVVCSNKATSRRTCCNVLSHEFVHAFDYCRAKLEFDNIDHLACTEIRAANFMHCSFMAAWVEGDAGYISPGIKAKHQECVKRKALMSILTVRNISKTEGMIAVDKVFDKCYNDLEPIGRRPRRKSEDPNRALVEGSLYGYSD